MDRTRVAGFVAAVGAAGGAMFSATQLVAPTEVSLGAGLVLCLFHLAAIVGLLALAAQGAAGQGWLGRIGLGVAVFGFLLLCVAEIADPFDTSISEPIFQAAPVILGVGLIMTGVAVLRERRWSGWRRWTPLAYGAYPFVLFLPLVIILGDDPGLWIALTGWDLVALALAVAVIVEAPAVRDAPADPSRARVG